MKNMFKRSLAAVMAVASLATGMVGMSASAVIVNKPNKFILNYATGAPGSEIQTTLTNYAEMKANDPAITIKLVYCKTSSNTKSCRFTIPLRADTESQWNYFSYADQKKDIALKSHGTNVYFTCEAYRTNANAEFGDFTFSGNAD